jgi:hypothetical protein
MCGQVFWFPDHELARRVGSCKFQNLITVGQGFMCPIPHASMIDFLSSSTPKGGDIATDVMMGGKQVGAAWNICCRILGIAKATSTSGRVSALFMTACNVNLDPADARHCASRPRSIAASDSLIPCLALRRMYTRHSLIIQNIRMWKRR